MYQLIIRPEAQEDMDHATQYYENRVPGKGAELIDEVKGKLKGLQSTPEMHQQLEFGVRRSNLKRFPYSLVYLVNNDLELVEILAFVHFRQSNTHWLTRI